MDTVSPLHVMDMASPRHIIDRVFQWHITNTESSPWQIPDTVSLWHMIDTESPWHITDRVFLWLIMDTAVTGSVTEILFGLSPDVLKLPLSLFSLPAWDFQNPALLSQTR
ncbi:unnamed protein product [Caretta caretta]